MLRQASWIFFSLAAVADYAALPSASFTDYSALYAPDVRYKILWIFVTHCGARDVTGSLALWARLRPTENPSRYPGFHPSGNPFTRERELGLYLFFRISFHPLYYHSISFSSHDHSYLVGFFLYFSWKIFGYFNNGRLWGIPKHQLLKFSSKPDLFRRLFYFSILTYRILICSAKTYFSL